MERIYTVKGDEYGYDEETMRIYKDGKLIPSTIAEPVFTNVDNYPQFSGIYLKDAGRIISKNGNINEIVDYNAIQ